MIWASFRIENPWYKYDPDREQKDVFCIIKPVTKNKYFETQLSYMPTRTLFDITIDTRWAGQSHAGPELTFELFGLYFAVSFKDQRHWHNIEARWQTEYEMQHEFDRYGDD